MQRKIHDLAATIFTKLTGQKPSRQYMTALIVLTALILLGTFFYAWQEGWSVVDSFYFTVITITTVGYGDLYPTTAASKLFTVFLILSGVGLGFYVVTSFAEKFSKGRNRLTDRIEKLFGMRDN